MKMNSLLLVSYFEKQAKSDGILQNLLQCTTDCIERLEQLQRLEKDLELQNLCATMDVHELKRIAKLYQLQFNQEFTAQECLREAYVSATELCLHVGNIDWDAQMKSDLQLLQWQYQQEMREAGERYERQRQRAEELEARDIVQQVRVVQAKLAKLREETENVRQCGAGEREELLSKYDKLKSKRNASIVQLLQCGKRCEERTKEIESFNIDVKMSTLEARKSELIQEFQKRNLELPNLASIQPCLVQTILPFATPKFASFTKQTVSKVIDNVEKKLPTFREFFAAWEGKRQAEHQQNTAASIHMSINALEPKISTTLTTTPMIVPLTTAANASVITTTTTTTQNVINTSAPVVTPLPARSILRRSFGELEDAITPSPKKRVRFAAPLEDSDDSNTAEGTTSDDSPRNADIEEKNVASVVANSTDDEPLFGSADVEFVDEIIVVPSQTQSEMDVSIGANRELVPIIIDQQNDEDASEKERQQRTPKKREVSELPNNSPKSKIAKPLIEIQECRIIKPAGSALPETLPVSLSPDATVAVAVAATATATTSTFTNSTDKNRKAPESDSFFNEFLKSSLESGSIAGSSQETASDAAETDVANKSFTLPKSPTNNESKTKNLQAKKFENDFESFFRQNMTATRTEVINAANDATTTMEQQQAADANDDDLLHFDMTANDNLCSDITFDDMGAGNDAYFFSIDSADEQNGDEMTENFL